MSATGECIHAERYRELFAQYQQLKLERDSLARTVEREREEFERELRRRGR